jgi:hypothetical protein
MIIILAVTSAAVGMISAMIGIKAFDRLVTLECARFPEQWRLDGQPKTLMSPDWGSFTVPPSVSGRLLLRWLVASPPWSSQAIGAEAPLRVLRAGFALWVIGSLAFVVLAMVAHGAAA